MLALWKGWLPSVIGVVPYVGLNFAVYETGKDVILKHYGERTRRIYVGYRIQYLGAVYETDKKSVILKHYGGGAPGPTAQRIASSSLSFAAYPNFDAAG